MSKIKLHTGFLYEVNIGDSTIEEWSRNKCEKLGLKITDQNKGKYNTYLELLLDTRREYKLINNRLYFCSDSEHGDLEIHYMDRNSDGSFSYIFRFDTETTCLDELLEESLKYAYKKS